MRTPFFFLLFDTPPPPPPLPPPRLNAHPESEAEAVKQMQCNGRLAHYMLLPLFAAHCLTTHPPTPSLWVSD